MDLTNPNKRKKLKKTKKSLRKSSNLIRSDINCLNDDCLISIFEYLPIQEKLDIELVCSRWNRVSKLSWSQVKAFKITANNVPFKYCTENEKAKNTNFVINSLKRSSNYLNKLFFDTKHPNLLNYSIIISELPKLCNNITELYLSNEKKYFLRENQTFIFTDEKLKLVFESNPNISSINLENLSINGDCLLSLNKNRINECSFHNCKLIKKNCLQNFFLNTKNLNKLQLQQTAEEINIILNSLLMSENNELFDISIGINFTSINSKYLIGNNLSIFIPKQKKLCKLKLRYFIIDNTLMESILTEDLEELDLGIIIIDKDKLIIKSFSCLKKLQVFRGSFRDVVDDDLIKELISSLPGNLKEFEISSSQFSLTYESINNFNKFANLEIFSISDYSSSSNRPIIGNLLKDLSQCKCLKHLVIDKFVLNEAELNSIGEMKNLIKLNFSNIDINDKNCIELIRKLTYLQELKISYSKFVTKNLIITASKIKCNRKDSHILNMHFWRSLKIRGNVIDVPLIKTKIDNDFTNPILATQHFKNNYIVNTAEFQLSGIQ